MNLPLSTSPPKTSPKLTYDVLIENEQDRRVSATVLGLPECKATGGTKEEALTSLRELLSARLAKAEIVSMEIEPPKTENPWMKFAGMFKDKVSLWVLDTDCVSLFQYRHPVVTQYINGVNPEEVAVTIITAEEQLRGRLNIIRQASSGDELISAYVKRRATLEFFKSVNMLDFNQDACTYYENLVRQRNRIGTRDLRIAAITLSVNGILVTHNQRDFAQVPNIQLQDWTIPNSSK